MGKIDQAFEYMTKRDMKDSAVEAAAQANKIKIIDMTGKEQKVMHGYESFGQMSRSGRLNTQFDGKPKRFDLPELMHNLDMLVSMTEGQIIQTDRKLKTYEDMIVSREYEARRGAELAKKQEAEINRMKEVIAFIE
jgi:tuftelin-interacting protein 11